MLELVEALPEELATHISSQVHTAMRATRALLIGNAIREANALTLAGVPIASRDAERIVALWTAICDACASDGVHLSWRAECLLNAHVSWLQHSQQYYESQS